MQFSIWIQILGSTLGILVLTCTGNSIGRSFGGRYEPFSRFCFGFLIFCMDSFLVVPRANMIRDELDDQGSFWGKIASEILSVEIIRHAAHASLVGASELDSALNSKLDSNIH